MNRNEISQYLPDTLYSQLTDRHTDCEVSVDGGTGCINAFRRLQATKHSNLKIILSIGGGTATEIFNEVTVDATRLQKLADTARTLVDDLGMNGIDIDWEYPSNEPQSLQYYRLIERLRTALPSPRYLVTIAVPAGAWALRHMNPGEVSKHVDMINLMAYDFVGPFPGVTKSGHHARLRSSEGGQNRSVIERISGETAISFLLRQGVPREKIILGLPLYGRSFIGANGPEQGFHGHGGRDGIIEFRHLLQTQSGQANGGGGPSHEASDDAITSVPPSENFDPDLVAAWRVGPNTNNGGEFITYDNDKSVRAKAEFVKDQGLGGLFYWHIGFDKPKGAGSLVDVGGEVLNVCGQK
jgi:chitinase